jgi:hypothetical protein
MPWRNRERSTVKKAFSLTVLLLVICATSASFALAGGAEAPPTPEGSSRPGVAIAFKSSSLGLGVESGVSMTRFLDIRGGFDAFSFSPTFSANGIHYNGTLRLRSAQALVDLKPFSDWFHISPGMMIYNGNQITAKANVPGGQTFSLGGVDFRSNPLNPINGTGQMTFKKAAPMVLFGFGTLVPHKRHFTFYNDIGVVFQGEPKTVLNLAGSACDPVTGLACVNAATDPTIQTQVTAEQTKINNDTKIAKYYPVFSLGFGFRF